MRTWTLVGSQSWIESQESAPLPPHVWPGKNRLSPQKRPEGLGLPCLLECPLSPMGDNVRLSGTRGCSGSSGRPRALGEPGMSPDYG